MRNVHEYDKIVILGGKEYINVVAKVFPASKLITLFKGLPCGKMMQAVKKAISKGELFRNVASEEVGWGTYNSKCRLNNFLMV